MKLLQKLDEIKNENQDSVAMFAMNKKMVRQTQYFDELSAAFLESVKFIEAYPYADHEDLMKHRDEFLQKIGGTK